MLRRNIKVVARQYWKRILGSVLRFYLSLRFLSGYATQIAPHSFSIEIRVFELRGPYVEVDNNVRKSPIAPTAGLNCI